MKQQLILLTNDDGFNSDGIKAMRSALSGLGRVVVVAPELEQSGTSHSLTIHSPVRIREVRKDIHSVTGFPSDCVYAGVHGLLPRKPDLIVSGINRGANMGVDVYYSGTVAGARQGIIEGVKSIATSLVADKKSRKLHWKDAAEFTKKVAAKMLKDGYSGAGFVNINYPNVPKSDIKGVKITKMGDRRYVTEVKWGKDLHGNDYCWLWGEYESFHKIESSDCVAVDDNYISITPMLIDTTDHDSIDELRGWNL